MRQVARTVFPSTRAAITCTRRFLSKLFMASSVSPDALIMHDRSSIVKGQFVGLKMLDLATDTGYKVPT